MPPRLLVDINATDIFDAMRDTPPPLRVL